MIKDNKINGRNVAFKVLVGSHNYNLNTENSDRDYKYFVIPTFDDLYEGVECHENVVTESEDYSIHDIRKLPHLLWKSNINFTEIMFSRDFREGVESARELCAVLNSRREELATMNLPYFYKACRGMSLQKQKDMLKDSPGRHESFEKFSYDTKSACHALRILSFLIRMKKNGFHFGESIWYGSEDEERDFLLRIKAGAYSLEEVKHFIRAYEYEAAKCEEVFATQKPNESIATTLKGLVKQVVKKGIRDSAL